MPVLKFLGSTPGRVLRVVVGFALVGAGVALGSGWLGLAAVGLIPLAAGVFDFCLLGPLVRLPLAGKAFRARCHVA